ncbi:transcriptional regulator, AraC family [Chitinophaga sp. YR573]|uniref:AraC family transcriptional regulator n=1 Tax=Chitinophaga sp. YR573 TaxID=1881040 RepID=UPI0008B85FDB|nr:helix-turn-helix transcriptional regulator [Chitinophaga sp. YR573]SEW45681.1 transcriptional regulator, AraC family [Chitinophaga sp. YR573]
MEKNIPVKNKINSEKHIKAEPFRKETRTTEPHKHKQYFELVFITTGTGEHWIDGIKYDVKPPVLFFITQDQVHNWDLKSEPDGYVVIIKKSFIEKSLDLQLKLLLNSISTLHCLYITENATLYRLFELLAEENKTETESSFPVIESLLKALLSKVQQIAGPGIDKISQKADLYQLFLKLLNQHNPIRNKVSYYAGILNTTPQNLNTACRKAIDLPAAEVLAGFIINEAKRLLLYTDKTVSEISFSLNFNDPSHFVKYFKRLSGYTPQSFRETK